MNGLVECVRPVSNPQNEIHNSLHFCTMNIEQPWCWRYFAQWIPWFYGRKRFSVAAASTFIVCVRVNWCSHFFLLPICSFFSFVKSECYLPTSHTFCKRCTRKSGARLSFWWFFSYLPFACTWSASVCCMLCLYMTIRRSEMLCTGMYRMPHYHLVVYMRWKGMLTSLMVFDAYDFKYSSYTVCCADVLDTLFIDGNQNLARKKYVYRSSHFSSFRYWFPATKVWQSSRSVAPMQSFRFACSGPTEFRSRNWRGQEKNLQPFCNKWVLFT